MVTQFWKVCLQPTVFPMKPPHPQRTKQLNFNWLFVTFKNRQESWITWPKTKQHPLWQSRCNHVLAKVVKKSRKQLKAFLPTSLTHFFSSSKLMILTIMEDFWNHRSLVRETNQVPIVNVPAQSIFPYHTSEKFIISRWFEVRLF